MKKRNWKNISKQLVTTHNEVGGKVMLNFPELDFESVPDWAKPFEHESPQVELPGEELSARDIRKFLWENRSMRCVTRDRSFIWSKYLPKSDSSVIGIGTLTTEKVLERMGA